MRALSFLLLLCVPFASAQTVMVGKETKQTTGIVTELNLGDVACYIKLKDDKGKERLELADFDLCLQESMIGKRVELTFTLQTVMADECQGDPECSKTRDAAVVTAMKVVKSSGTSKPKSPPSPTSYCSAQEIVVFNCRTGAKLVSVCASRDASPKRGYVQYRFGKPGEAPEMTLPPGQVPPPRAATGTSVPFSGGGGVWMRFQNAMYAYVVYSGIGNWGPRGEKAEKQGVVVERSGARIAHLPCSGPLTGELGPDWLDTAGVESGDQDFEFPD